MNCADCLPHFPGELFAISEDSGLHFPSSTSTASTCSYLQQGLGFGPSHTSLSHFCLSWIHQSCPLLWQVQACSSLEQLRPWWIAYMVVTSLLGMGPRCANCVAFGKFTHHSVSSLCDLKTGDVNDAGFPRCLRSSAVRMPIQFLAGCLAHPQCHSGDGVDGRAHPEAGPLRLPFPISSEGLRLLLLPVSDWLLCEQPMRMSPRTSRAFHLTTSPLSWTGSYASPSVQLP